MQPLTIDDYLCLIAEARPFDPKEAPVQEASPFPMSEEAAGNLLGDCGFQGGHAMLRQMRESDEVDATPEAWSREAIEQVAECLSELESVKFDVFACYGLGVEYMDYQIAYLNACKNVLEEYPFASVAGMFGPRELVNPDWFEKTFLPPRLGRKGLAEFKLADDIRQMLDADKAFRDSARDAAAYAALAASCAKTASEHYFGSHWPIWYPVTNGALLCVGDNNPFAAGPEWRERQIERFRGWLKEKGIEELASAYDGDDNYTFVMLVGSKDLDAVRDAYQRCVKETIEAIGASKK